MTSRKPSWPRAAKSSPRSRPIGQTNYRPSLLKVASTKPDLAYIVITQGHPALVEQAGQIQGFPVGAGTTFLRPAFGYPPSVGWYQSAIKSGISPELNKEFMQRYKDFAEKAKVKDMPFFAQMFDSTNILLKAIDHVLGKGQPVTGENLRAAVFEIKSFGSSIGTITFDKSNTAVRGVRDPAIHKGRSESRGGRRISWGMIPKSGNRFSEKIMLKRKDQRQV